MKSLRKKNFRIFCINVVNICILRRLLIRSYSIQSCWFSSSIVDAETFSLVAIPEIRRQLLRFSSASVGCEYLLFPLSLSPSFPFILLRSCSALSCRRHSHALLTIRRIAPSWCRAISAKHAQPSVSMDQLHCNFLHTLQYRKRIFNSSLLCFQTRRICRSTS